MDRLFSIDWSQLVIPTHSIAEMVIRGTLMYLGLFLLMRVTMKRQAGSFSMADILLIVLIADAAQNGFANEYRSITEGLVLVATIIFWDIAIDWLGQRSRNFARFVSPPPLLLVRDGHMLRANMRQEFITPEEMMSHLRQQGIQKLAEVKRAYMEPDGQISVIKMPHHG
jgi:uncharacterized membrane protein YcaP (DUF421 family)